MMRKGNMFTKGIGIIAIILLTIMSIYFITNISMQEEIRTILKFSIAVLIILLFAILFG